MIFNDQGNTKEIIFEDSDSDSEKRIVEQGLAFIRNLLQRLNEIEEHLIKHTHRGNQ